MINPVKIVFTLICFSFLIFLLSGCAKNGGDGPASKISGIVTDRSTGATLSDVLVNLYDSATQAPRTTTTTDKSGNYTFYVPAGTYYLIFSKQGYLSMPAQGIPIYFKVALNVTSTQSAQMIANTVANAGYISGKVSVSNSGKPSVLVVARSGSTALSAVSDNEGNYTIYNMPAASYYVRGYFANFTTDSVAATVTADTQTQNINITLTQGASGSVAGSFNLQNATGITAYPAKLDLSLIHPITKEAIPGLSQSPAYASQFNFSFSQVPDGTYAIRASYANDGIIVDADRRVKLGDYTVKVSRGAPTPSMVNIVATSAIHLISPNDSTSTSPLEINDPRPVFSWHAYPETNDFVIEVTDVSTGEVIWGGFTTQNGIPTKNISILSSTTSIQYNADGKAKATLLSGRVYRWRIYGSKNDTSTLGWHLISSSEDQSGVFKIK